MDQQEAKQVLGFTPDATPTAQEINKAWRRTLFKVGGDQDHQKLAAARDALEKPASYTYERPEKTAYGEPKQTGDSYGAARGRAGIPSGVEWLFITDSQRGKGWSSDESSKSDYAWVAYGRTDNQHVFVGMRHYTRQDFFIGGTNNEDDWTIKSQEYSIREDEGKNPRWLYGNVVRALKSVGYSGRFNSKVVDAEGKRLNDPPEIWSSSSTSIKHWLVARGEVAGDDPSVAGRKQVVETIVHRVSQEKAGYYPEAPARWNTIRGEYHGDWYRFEVKINGKPHILSADDFQKFSSMKVGGKVMLNAIYGRYYYDDSRKTLTRLRAGKQILEWMSENLTDLPSDAREALAQASAQMRR